jgi:hypothetical protein
MCILLTCILNMWACILSYLESVYFEWKLIFLRFLCLL